ncbi:MULTISPECIES: nucleotide disphospho-sugar-binding domain-containing protein [Kitasatospora]|uniref:Putative glycosyltransferase n=1 Tax=Kitasatospora setae (strain ATCC 33774 / DSM 43861 / JCM 3304 / KCC A-0304 / NBRC 14216 / KM-6054) TaxID=452652 RepID=E4N298_KITSK|nr:MULTISPECIES: nucleotide disphospho-sugar-binding domain-containing protein [Kitasatospora]BAJ32282.1 putative glycosyltransferase [Kitasatospora setae KM-6054]
MPATPVPRTPDTPDTPGKRLLIVVPPLSGHLLPARALALAWAARGHLVSWVGPEAALRPLLGPDAEVHPTGARLFREQAAGGAAAVRSLWEGFVVPHTRFTLGAVRRAVARWRPDVVLVDQHSPAGALAAHAAGVPWASFAPSSLEIGDPLGGDGELTGWRDGVLRGLWERAGLPAAEYADPRFSPGLVVAPSSAALLGLEPSAVPAEYALVGPLLADRPDVPFPWDALAPDRRRVLVTMGTLSAEVAGDFLGRTAAALAELPDVQAVVAAPGEVALPPGAIGRAHVPVLELLERGAVDAVLCHGGMNTVGESLVHGRPLVLAPIRHDQPVTAGRLAALGAAVHVDFATASPERLRAALRAVLDRPGFRSAAELLGRQLREGGGAVAAAERLERFACAPR